MVCGHSIHFRSIGYGQIGMVEPSKEASISRTNPRHQSRAEQIRIMEIKIEKGAILLHSTSTSGDPGCQKKPPLPIKLLVS
jgi:hypothetical protein